MELVSNATISKHEYCINISKQHNLVFNKLPTGATESIGPMGGCKFE